MNADADRILQSLDIPAKATQQLANCSIAIQQMVAIARAVDMDCKVLILDEPTSSLDDKEVQKLFGLMKDLRARGVGIIFVTHFLDQVYEVCDRITVLRDGKLVGEYEIEKLPRVQLVARCWAKSWTMRRRSKMRRRYIMRMKMFHRYLKWNSYRVTQASNHLISI